MLVYGDHSERLNSRVRLDEIAGRLRTKVSHEELRTAFIDLAGIVQGVADADFASAGEDRDRPAERALLTELTELGRHLLHSWDDGCTGALVPPLQLPADLPAEIEVRSPEGYAFYALYPEAYGLAARQLELGAPPRFIGLRSIGSGLACMAAGALGAPPPITLRPVGHPFARSLRIGADLAARLLHGEAHYVIVDEGPGLSGSSLGAVADWLEQHGIAAERIAFLPGHAGELGPRASRLHRQRWARSPKPVVTTAEIMQQRLPLWLGTLVGPLAEPLRDISGGRWRSLWSNSEQDWPAANPSWERTKYLARTATGTWLVKFAGLGRIGERKLALASWLSDAGFGPDVAGLREGWLITRWYGDARPGRPTAEELTRYLSLRASLTARQAGASLTELIAMAVHNAPAQLGGWSPDLATIRSNPVIVDGRMNAHEWLRLPSDRLLKADAVDHHAAHDLIGCQDIAWDVAGAVIELDLTEGDAAVLAARQETGANSLDFYLRCYLAFRIGTHRMSESMVDASERHRHVAGARRYEARLSALVNGVQYSRDLDQPVRFGVEASA